MKISEALLYAHREAGAADGIPAIQIQKYIKQLHTAGMLAFEMRDTTKGQPRELFVQLTDKGQEYLRKAGL